MVIWPFLFPERNGGCRVVFPLVFLICSPFSPIVFVVLNDFLNVCDVLMVTSPPSLSPSLPPLSLSPLSPSSLFLSQRGGREGEREGGDVTMRTSQTFKKSLSTTKTMGLKGEQIKKTKGKTTRHPPFLSGNRKGQITKTLPP